MDVSFVIPTLNAEALLRRCLASIRRQTVPDGTYEILVADGGSTDGTRDVARELGARVLDNPDRLAEAGKQRAFDAAQGRYLALVDADNEVAGPDWLATVLRGLERHPEALGFESTYLPHPEHTALNRYLTGLLQISDPYARSIAEPLTLERRDDDGIELYRLPASGGYPTGANGFVFDRERLDEVAWRHGYHEAAFFPELMRAGRRTLVKARGPSIGIHHHYVASWRDYLAKRRYAMILYMLRKEETRQTWDGAGLGRRKLGALAYHLTLVPPLVEGVGRAVSDRNADWLLHPAASAVSSLGNLLGIAEYHLRSGRASRRQSAIRRHRHPEAGHPRASGTSKEMDP
ncbi:MAG: glycosyltransferase family 2 protein [Acidobacteriota bacterium]